MSQENNQAQAEEENAKQESAESAVTATSSNTRKNEAKEQAEPSGQRKAEQSDAGKSDAGKSDAGENDNEHEVADELAALKAEELIKRVKDAQEKADENWDVALRAKAEMDNVRRRTEKEIANARKFGVEKLANELLPVKDSMEMGIKAVKEIETQNDVTTKVLEGMEMTLNMMSAAMEKVGIEEVAPETGDTFNPELHQAMSMQEVEGAKSNTIISAFQKGYTLKDRLMRPAMVMVAK